MTDRKAVTYVLPFMTTYQPNAARDEAHDQDRRAIPASKRVKDQTAVLHRPRMSDDGLRFDHTIKFAEGSDGDMNVAAAHSTSVQTRELGQSAPPTLPRSERAPRDTSSSSMCDFMSNTEATLSDASSLASCQARILPTLRHPDLAASDTWGSSPSPASAWHPDDWQELEYTFPFTGPALPVEVWDMVLDCFVSAQPGELLELSLVCQHWWTRCSPYLVRNIVFNNRGDVLRECRTRRRDWRGPRCVTIKGAENTRSLSHLGLIAALFGPRWTNVRDVVIEHGDWRTGDFHQDVFDYLHILLEEIEVLRVHDVTFPSGATLRSLVSHTRCLKLGYNETSRTLSLAQVRFENASMPPASLSWMNNSVRPTPRCMLQLDHLDSTSLDVIAHWLLVAPDRHHMLLPYIWFSLGNLDDSHLDTVPHIIQFLKMVGDRTDRVELNINQSLGLNVLWMAPQGGLKLGDIRTVPD
ncbi:hypothetical protein IEO21_08416 [Rhodonia placenta]|uniref:F-box domain-containing protein n=1 Tax=Rhodonia placenta TaxID=104341 RepID=A0A8H7NW76_9APHY|nr:hypothetical protein IEO21_08416 [Postia placenta]